jgi:hypothetical protein
MAYYTALINGWNSVTQPPAGVTGTGLTAQMTTAQKLANVNAWTVTGSVPTSFYVSGADLLNCLDKTEFNALTAAQQSNLLWMCSCAGPLLGGSAQTSHLAAGLILTYFTNLGGPTIANLTALAKATTQPWWQFSGYPRAFDLGDVSAAGLS